MAGGRRPGRRGRTSLGGRGASAEAGPPARARVLCLGDSGRAAGVKAERVSLLALRLTLGCSPQPEEAPGLGTAIPPGPSRVYPRRACRLVT